MSTDDALLVMIVGPLLGGVFIAVVETVDRWPRRYGRRRCRSRLGPPWRKMACRCKLTRPHRRHFHQCKCGLSWG